MENTSFFIDSTSDSLAMRPTTLTENQTLDCPVVIVLCIVLGLGSIFGTTGNTLVVSRHNQVRELESYTRLVHFQPINIGPPRFGIVSTFKSIQDCTFVRWLHGYEVCDIYKRLSWICRADCFSNKHAWSNRGTPNVHSISPKICTSGDKNTCCGDIHLYGSFQVILWRFFLEQF